MTTSNATRQTCAFWKNITQHALTFSQKVHLYNTLVHCEVSYFNVKKVFSHPISHHILTTIACLIYNILQRQETYTHKKWYLKN